MTANPTWPWYGKGISWLARLPSSGQRYFHVWLGLELQSRSPATVSFNLLAMFLLCRVVLSLLAQRWSQDTSRLSSSCREESPLLIVLDKTQDWLWLTDLGHVPNWSNLGDTVLLLARLESHVHYGSCKGRRSQFHSNHMDWKRKKGNSVWLPEDGVPGSQNQ